MDKDSLLRISLTIASNSISFLVNSFCMSADVLNQGSTLNSRGNSRYLDRFYFILIRRYEGNYMRYETVGFLG